MLIELFAILTAISRGFANVFTKKGLRDSNPDTSVFVSLIVQTILLWTFVIFVRNPNSWTINGIEFFIIAGFLYPGFVLLLMNMSFNRVGVAMTIPILNTSIIVAVFGAFLFLDEIMTLFIILGVALVFIGTFILLWQKNKVTRWVKSDLIFPLLAALLLGCAIDIQKIGLMKGISPILGAATTSVISIITLLVYLVSTKKIRSLNFNRNSMKFFVSSGFFEGLSFIFFFTALLSGNVNLVQPIAGSEALFAVLFSWIFLKEEKITTNIFLGAILVVFGVILVSV